MITTKFKLGNDLAEALYRLCDYVAPESPDYLPDEELRKPIEESFDLLVDVFDKVS